MQAHVLYKNMTNQHATRLSPYWKHNEIPLKTIVPAGRSEAKKWRKKSHARNVLGNELNVLATDGHDNCLITGSTGNTASLNNPLLMTTKASTLTSLLIRPVGCVWEWERVPAHAEGERAESKSAQDKLLTLVESGFICNYKQGEKKSQQEPNSECCRC